jgi:hypothetical protein
MAEYTRKHLAQIRTTLGSNLYRSTSCETFIDLQLIFTSKNFVIESPLEGKLDSASSTRVFDSWLQRRDLFPVWLAGLCHQACAIKPVPSSLCHQE